MLNRSDTLHRLPYKRFDFSLLSWSVSSPTFTMLQTASQPVLPGAGVGIFDEPNKTESDTAKQDRVIYSVIGAGDKAVLVRVPPAASEPSAPERMATLFASLEASLADEPDPESLKFADELAERLNSMNERGLSDELIDTVAKEWAAYRD